MIVVDASVAVKWIFSEEHADRARAQLRSALTQREDIAAPPLLTSEVTNVIRQRMRREALPLNAARERIMEFLAVPVSFHAPDDLYRHALEIADEHNLPAAYDAHFVALADLLKCDLWTADQRLLRALHGALPFVRSIAEYSIS